MHRLRHNPGWTVEYKLPVGPKWTLTGRSRAKESTGFCLVEPGIFLDAGVPCRAWKPHVILITHTHFDHVAALPSLLRGTQYVPLIVMPQPLVRRLHEYVKSSWAIKVPDAKSLPFRHSANVSASKTHTESGVFLDLIAGCWIPMRPQQMISLNTEQVLKDHSIEKFEEHSLIKGGGPRGNLFVTGINCFHTMDDLGYIISEKRRRRRTDLASLSQHEIAQLAKQGQCVTEDVMLYHLAYLCDTSIRVFDVNNTIAASTLWQCAVIMVECTFLAQDMESEATNRGHICWTQLKPVVEAHPDNLFILIHFSLRYSDDEIRAFFVEHGQPSNVKLWLDDGVV